MAQWTRLARGDEAETTGLGIVLIASVERRSRFTESREAFVLCAWLDAYLAGESLRQRQIHTPR
jgi:hypothetical protein